MSPSLDPTTRVLLRGAQAGDAQAANRLFERYRERLLQVVSLLLARRRAELLEDEEDIVQETLLEAFRHLGSFTPRSDGALLHWLARMAENNLRDAVRRARTRKRGEGRERALGDLPSEFLVSSLFPGREPSPSQVAARAELAGAIEIQVLALPERQRRAFVLRQLCGLSFEDLASELGLAGAPSARTLCSRAMARVTARLPDLR